MTTGIIDFHTSDGYYFSIYIGSDADPKSIKDLWHSYCKLVDNDTQKHKSILNWIYIVTNFTTYMHRELYSHKSIESCNRILICPADCNWTSIYRYKIEPIEDLYGNITHSLKESSKFKVLRKGQK